VRRGTSVGEGRKGKGREIVFAEYGGSCGASCNAVRGEEEDDDDDGRSAKAAEARLR
jgi:hypothetical protein